MMTRLAFPCVGALVLLIVSAEISVAGYPGYGYGYSGCESCGGPNQNRCVENCYLEPLRRAELYNWNRRYAHVQYGQPVAMVVPPTANLQTNWGWGVSSFRMSRLDHQFGRNYPGFGTYGAPYRTTPVWPWDTTQFGVYNVRGPW